MAAEQFDQLADQLGLVVAPGVEVAPAHLREDFLTGFWLIAVLLARSHPFLSQPGLPGSPVAPLR
jgi:hypothetical protein